MEEVRKMYGVLSTLLGTLLRTRTASVREYQTSHSTLPQI